MELVYLWVQEYKNIKNQGFNFSPRFTCKYNKDTKELTIDENKEYVSIFPDNINITAIVGKNGSGKSTIQKLIFLLIFLKKYQNIDISKHENSQKEEAIINILKDKKLRDKNIFLIIKTDQGFKKISLLASINEYQQENIKKFKISSAECCLKEKYDELKLEEINFFSTHFHYMIDTWYDDFYDKWTNSIYHRVDGYDTPLLLEPYKGHEEDKNYIDISNIEYLNNGKIFDFYAHLKENKHVNRFFNPEFIWMMIDSNKILNKYQNFDGFPIDENMQKRFKDFIDEKVKNKDLLALNKIYLAMKIISSRKEIFNDESIIQTTRDKLINIKTLDEFKNFLEEFEVKDILQKANLPETQKIEVCIDFHSSFSGDSEKLKIYQDFLVLDPTADDESNFHELNKVFDVFNKIVPWIYIEFYDADKSYSSLSSGEKMFLSFLINAMYQIRNIESLANQPYKTINLFLDEVEFGLHPEWQKRFIQEVFYMLKNFKSKFNIFYATHSPFILSDLPKENVIFLKEGKQDKTVNIDTFGANIHTLLSHGFFMQDGLMGEFAKEKINEVISILKKETLSKDEINTCKNIISIIGEPILKSTLEKMLDEKLSLNESELEKLEREQKEIQEKIDRLKAKK